MSTRVSTTRRAASTASSSRVSAPICRGRFRLTPASAVPCSPVVGPATSATRSSCGAVARGCPVTSRATRSASTAARTSARASGASNRVDAVLSCSVSWRRSVVVRACTPGTVRMLSAATPEFRVVTAWICPVRSIWAAVSVSLTVENSSWSVRGGICPQNRALRSRSSVPRPASYCRTVYTPPEAAGISLIMVENGRFSPR